MATSEKRSCPQKQLLMQRVQESLVSLSELTRGAVDALKKEDRDTVRRLDNEIETKLGEKERNMGALREHEAEHGC